jgi:hypothetical protein
MSARSAITITLPSERNTPYCSPALCPGAPPPTPELLDNDPEIPELDGWALEQLNDVQVLPETSTPRASGRRFAICRELLDQKSTALMATLPLSAAASSGEDCC